VLKPNPGAAVVYDLRSSRSVAEAIREAGGEPVESRVGHVFMKAALAQTAAPIGGELSGHFYFADLWNTDSGVRAFIEVLNLLASSGRTLSACVAPFRRYAQSGEINFENADTAGTLERLKARYAAAAMKELDGLSLDTGAWWANIRRSNTEPLLRLNLEARDPAAVSAALAELEPILGHRVDH
jgi:phosphomannomutase